MTSRHLPPDRAFLFPARSVGVDLGAMHKYAVSLIAGVCLAFGPVVSAQEKGVINDPDGFTNIRSAGRNDAAVVARVKSEEVFEFEPAEDSEWWKVTLKSGKSGWMHRSRIRFHFTLDEIPEKDEEGSEIGSYAKERGFDYCVTARAAAQGKPDAMKLYFAITDTDGGAAEGHASFFNMVIHLLGDDRLAAFLDAQPLDLRLGVRNQMGDFVLYPFESVTYVERNFPKTAAVLYRKEITGWPSPDGRLLIHKVFSEARATETSKVVRAELIEKKTGRAIADLTSADIGHGSYREGNVMWSPDSKRFAFFSGSQGGAGQTVVFQNEGGAFKRVPQAEVKLPGRDADAEVKGASHLWTFEEPVRWAAADVLVLMHHEYFEGKRPDGSINSIGRTYEITRNLTTGEGAVKMVEH